MGLAPGNFIVQFSPYGAQKFSASLAMSMGIVYTDSKILKAISGFTHAVNRYFSHIAQSWGLLWHVVRERLARLTGILRYGTNRPSDSKSIIGQHPL